MKLKKEKKNNEIVSEKWNRQKSAQFYTHFVHL